MSLRIRTAAAIAAMPLEYIRVSVDGTRHSSGFSIAAWRRLEAFSNKSAPKVPKEQDVKS